jgi:hypothetical protein
MKPTLVAVSLASCLLLSLAGGCSSSSGGSSSGSSSSSSSGSSSGGGAECSAMAGDAADGLCSYSYGAVADCVSPLFLGACPAAGLAACCGKPGVGGNCYYGSSAYTVAECMGAGGTYYTSPP